MTAKRRPRDSGRTVDHVRPSSGGKLLTVSNPGWKVHLVVDVRGDNDVLYRVELEDALGLEEPSKYQGTNFQTADRILWETVARMKGQP